MLIILVWYCQWRIEYESNSGFRNGCIYIGYSQANLTKNAIVLTRGQGKRAESQVKQESLIEVGTGLCYPSGEGRHLIELRHCQYYCSKTPLVTQSREGGQTWPHDCLNKCCVWQTTVPCNLRQSGWEPWVSRVEVRLRPKNCLVVATENVVVLLCIYDIHLVYIENVWC